MVFSDTVTIGRHRVCLQWDDEFGFRISAYELESERAAAALTGVASQALEFVELVLEELAGKPKPEQCAYLMKLSASLREIERRPFTLGPTLSLISWAPDSRRIWAAKVTESERILRRLASDLWPEVRRVVASNPRTPREVLHQLSVDQDPSTCRGARRTLRQLGAQAL